MFLNDKKMQQVYIQELIKIFMEALSKDNDSKYHNMEHYKILEDILNNNLTFRIDKNNIIYEVYPDKKEAEIFKNNKKNTEAIYAIKILLSEYGNENEKEL